MLFLRRIGRFLAVPLALLTLATGFSPVTRTRQAQMEAQLADEVEQAFEPVFRFAVASDVHIKADDLTNAERFGRLFVTAYSSSAPV